MSLKDLTVCAFPCRALRRLEIRAPTVVVHSMVAEIVSHPTADGQIGLV